MRASRHTGRAILAVFPLLFLVAVACVAVSAVASTGSTTLRQAGELRHVTIGAAAASRYLSEPEYAAILGSEFSQLQAENEMKFGLIHPRPDTDPNPYDFCRRGRARCLRATSQPAAPRPCSRLAQAGVGVGEARQLPANTAHRHPRKSHSFGAHHYAGTVCAWDVVNEAFNSDGTMRHTIWYDRPGISGSAGAGTSYIEQALKWARQADPNAKSFYNDYDAEEINQKSDAIYAMAADFKKRGVPLDGIGFQTHISLKFDDPAKLESFARNLERFAKLDYQLAITELDIRLSDSTPESLAAQAKLYREITQLCVQQSACKLIQTWGVSDQHSWIPQFYEGQGWALLWDANDQRKPAYFAVGDAPAK